ncbi:hypothetical protein NLX83_23670 [Allokutzneria sp. A3M-2-11 16]|uniref:hypothetical protein n=1 Tax=Allokutzneria sp. A3M-2-11 16 TaxID=2962043 RepID=UPI0020B8F55A|nr:hypothetical protein [Allokutzneria sp. A3M-2-11 16]MCP3802273.1 hypothetical protein [Allokutzneria sp. A3M-2-11 16]
MSVPSATMAVWASAWLHGAAAADDVLDALTVWGELQEVVAADHETATRTGLPVDGERAAGPALWLAALRRSGADGAALVLPVPGDVRGLGGAGPAMPPALERGEAVVFAGAGLAAVPDDVADGVLRWTVFPLPGSPGADHTPIGEAEHGMTIAVREAAATLVSLDVARHRPNVRAEIAEFISARPRLAWPPAMPPRSLRVLERANEVEAILRAALGDDAGGAVSASAARARTEALKPLSDAVRGARRVAIAEAVRQLRHSPQDINGG